MANIQITLDDEIYNIPIDDYPYLAQGATFKPYTKQLAGNKIEIGYTNDFGLTNPEPVTLEFPQLSDADRTSYNGQLYDTIGERIDADIQDLQNKIDSVACEGTTIHADNTAARNLTVNGNNVEVLGQTIQNCLDHSSADKFAQLDGSIDDGYIKITADGSSSKVASIKKDNGIIKPSTIYTFIVEILENTLTGNAASIVFETSVSSSTCFNDRAAISPVIGKKGIYKLKLTSRADITSATTLASACAVTLASDVTGSIKFRYAIVEGDWTEKDISWVPFGLNYPESTEIVQCGKNFYNEKTGIKYGYYSDGSGEHVPSNNSFCCTNVFPICPNKKYVVSSNLKFYSIWKFDGNKKPIKRVGSSLFNSENAYYICVNLSLPSQNIEDFKWLQVELAEIATDYSPYSGSNVNIDYHLRSINDKIRDRIYTLNRKVYYEQNVKEVIYDGSDDEVWNTDGDNKSYYYARVDDLKNNSIILCDKAYYVSFYGQLKEGTCSASTVIIIGCDRELYPTVSEWRQHLLTNPIKVLYQLSNPIVTEIAIEDFQSYAEQTNWFTTNTVKPYLKASIPSGIDASEAMHEILEARISYDGRKFDSLDERLDYDFNEVRGKVDVANYKGTTIHANNTYARNLVVNRNKVEVLGQTIQNCLDHSSADKFVTLNGTIEDGYIAITADGTEKRFRTKPTSGVIKPSTLYTFIVEIKENTLTPDTNALGFGEIDVNDKSCFTASKYINASIGITKFTLTTKDDFVGVNYLDRAKIDQTVTSGSIKFRYAIVEGDWTNKEISFVPFGLNYPETTEVVERSKNLIDLSKLNLNNALAWSTGATFNEEKSVVTDYILVTENKSYYTNYKAQVFYYDVDKKFIKHQGVSGTDTLTNFTIENGIRYVRLGFRSYTNSNEDMTLKTDFMLSQDSRLPYEPYTERKVSINYSLASTSESDMDRYYVKDGKKYHEQNVEEITLDGSERWGWQSDAKVFSITIGKSIDISKRSCKCSHFPSIKGANPQSVDYLLCGFNTASVYSEYFYVKGVGEFDMTVEEFKQWLSVNKPKLLYQILPVITEIETEDIQSFEGQTNITTTNIIKPTLDIDIPSNLNAVVSNLMVENASLKQENQALSNELENQKSSIETQQANVDYISMMTGVDL